MRIRYFVIALLCLLSLQIDAQCDAVLDAGIKEYNDISGTIQRHIERLNNLELFFTNLDANCKSEIGNRAALYVGRIRDLKAELLSKQKREALQRKIAQDKKAEEERLELERIQREHEQRVSKNLIFVDGYGHLPDGSDIPIVRLIKAELAKYNFKFTSKPEKAVWSIYIAVDGKDARRTNQGDYMALAIPMMVIENLIEEEEVYDGSGIDESFFDDPTIYQDGMYSRGPNESDAIRNAFFQCIKPISETITKTIKYE